MNFVERALGFQGGGVDNITGEEVQGNNSFNSRAETNPPFPTELTFVT